MRRMISYHIRPKIDRPSVFSLVCELMMLLPRLCQGSRLGFQGFRSWQRQQKRKTKDAPWLPCIAFPLHCTHISGFFFLVNFFLKGLEEDDASTPACKGKTLSRVKE